MTFVLGILCGMVLMLVILIIVLPRKDWDQLHADRMHRQCIAIERIADALQPTPPGRGRI